MGHSQVNNIDQTDTISTNIFNQDKPKRCNRNRSIRSINTLFPISRSIQQPKTSSIPRKYAQSSQLYLPLPAASMECLVNGAFFDQILALRMSKTLPHQAATIMTSGSESILTTFSLRSDNLYLRKCLVKNSGKSVSAIGDR